MTKENVIYEIGKIPYDIDKAILFLFFALAFLSYVVNAFFEKKIGNIILGLILLIGFSYASFLSVDQQIQYHNEIYKPYHDGKYKEVSGEVKDIKTEYDGTVMKFSVKNIQFKCEEKTPGFSLRDFNIKTGKVITNGDKVLIKYVYSKYEDGRIGVPYVILYIEKIR